MSGKTSSASSNFHHFVNRLVRSASYGLCHPSSTLFGVLLVYLVTMDVLLYSRIRSRSSFDPTVKNESQNELIENSQKSFGKTIHIFDPLPIKKMMMEPMVHYVRSPIAEQIESSFHFSFYFPWITANMISYFHCFLALISVKFLSNDSLKRRRIGVLIFQFRTFLDCLDGVIFRAHLKNKHYKSYYGSFGYYVDGFSDVFGGICLIISCLIYLNKKRPSRSSRTSRFSSSSEEAEKILPMSDEETRSTRINLLLSKEENSESKQTVFLGLIYFSFRYALAALFWDRTVASYEEIFDSQSTRFENQKIQLSLLHSPLTILIFYFWRYFCALSIQDYLQVAIFLDRTWEFVEKTKTISFWILFSLIVLSELHLDQIRCVLDVTNF